MLFNLFSDLLLAFGCAFLVLCVLGIFLAIDWIWVSLLSLIFRIPKD
jgi:hypothetical protein